jgi:hypothetical protein
VGFVLNNARPLIDSVKGKRRTRDKETEVQS